MPSRTSFAPRRLPCRLSFFLRFPKYKIQRIFFLIFSGYQKGTFTRTKIIQILVRKLTVIFELSCTVIYGTILLICKSFINQRLDHIYHTADFFRRKRILGCWFDIHTVHIFFTLCNVTFGNLIGCHPFFDGFFDDLIVYICKVGYIIHIISFVFKISPDRVEYDHWSGISNMDKVIYGRPAYIHLYLSFFQRYKFFFFLCHCIKNLHFSRSPPLFLPVSDSLLNIACVSPSPGSVCAFLCYLPAVL